MNQGNLFDDAPSPNDARPPAEPKPKPTPPPAADDERGLDLEARRLATREFEAPLVLEAGAGTGKTATLVARIVCWSLGPGWELECAELAGAPAEQQEPERIAARVMERTAAITFTEAAAAEMASRVGQALARVQEGELFVGVDESDFAIDGDTRRLRAAALRTALDRLDVRTIHAFCRRILAAYPLEARLAPEFEVDATEARMEAVTREVLERVLRDAWSDPVDEEMVELATLGKGPQQIEAALLELIRKDARSEDFAADPLGGDEVRTMHTALVESVQAMAAADTARLHAAPRNHTATLGAAGALEDTLAQLPENAPQNAAELQALCETLQTLWPENLAKKVKSWGSNEIGAGEKKLLADSLGDFEAAAPGFHSALTPFLDMDPALLDLARRVVKRLLSHVEDEMRARGIVTFNDLLRDTRELLEREPVIAARIRGGIRQLLVDEFQDTDKTQCAILRSLALDGPAKSRPGLFLVGDPKQSIYGWRNADLEAYEAFVGELEQAGGKRSYLTVNFRSVPAVLDEVERAVRPVMHELTGLQPKFQPLLPSEANAGREGFRTNGWREVEHWAAWPIDTESGRPAPSKERVKTASYEAEARAVAQDVARLHAEGVPWKEIAVLFRSKSDVDTFLHAMRECGIPYEVQGDKDYYRRREVIDAAALVRCVLDPNDHLALVTLMRSPWVGVPDAALIPLWRERLPHFASLLRKPDPEQLAEIESAIGAASAELPEDLPGLEQVKGWEASLLHALRGLATSRASFARDPADDFVRCLRETFLPDVSEAARYLGAYRLANLDRFFRELLRGVEEGAGDTQALLRTIRSSVTRAREAEEGRPSDAAEDAVQVLTIHGAKGLDFTHVYLVQLHKGTGEPFAPTVDFERYEGRADYVLFGAATPRFGSVRERRKSVEAAERVRLLYVAMTRAKERLVLSAGWSLEPKQRPWDRCHSFVELLEHRHAAAESVLRLFATCETESEASFEDEFGAAWSVPSTRDADERATESAAEVSLPSARTIAGHAKRLGEAREEADRRAARARSAAASEEAHTHLAEAFASESSDDAMGASAPHQGLRSGDARSAAMAAGAAVHRALEHFDFDAEAASELARHREEIPRHVARLCEGDARTAAAARAGELLDLVGANGMLARLSALAPHIVARELPVFLPPGDADDDPVGFVGGAIDLVYRDPETQEIVVADYKTDAVEADADVAERADAYASQGARYAEAVEKALGLDATPRVELWFLHAGAVEVR